MTPDDLRSRLEALLGPVHLADRAAEALGCDRRSVNRWIQGHQKVPLWVERHVETVEAVSSLALVAGIDPVHILPAEWGGMPF